MTNNKKLLGKRIQELRKRANLTQEKLAEFAGVNEKHISKLELGTYKPNLDTFRIQRTIWLNVITPLVCGLLSIAMLLTFSVLLPDWNRFFPFMISYLFYFELSMGITALVWPTKKMGRRVLIEGIYATIKTAIVFGFFTLFFVICHLWAVLSYTLALLLTFLSNFPLAYLAWKIKNKNVYKM